MTSALKSCEVFMSERREKEENPDACSQDLLIQLHTRFYQQIVSAQHTHGRPITTQSPSALSHPS